MTHDEVDDDAVQQIAAGIALIRASSLMIFDDKSKTFIPTDMQSFERTAADVHPRFGRVMKWIWLSTGAEYLLKGALISNRDFVPSAGTAEKLDLPAADELDKFIDEVFTIARKSPAKDYKTLSAMQEGLKKLCSRHRDEVRRAKSLRAAFTLLGESVRNRDAHAYVPDQRIGHFHLLNLFGPAFDTLLAWAQPDLVERAVEKAREGQ